MSQPGLTTGRPTGVNWQEIVPPSGPSPHSGARPEPQPTGSTAPSGGGDLLPAPTPTTRPQTRALPTTCPTPLCPLPTPLAEFRAPEALITSPGDTPCVPNFT